MQELTNWDGWFYVAVIPVSLFISLVLRLFQIRIRAVHVLIQSTFLLVQIFGLIMMVVSR